MKKKDIDRGRKQFFQAGIVFIVLLGVWIFASQANAASGMTEDKEEDILVQVFVSSVSPGEIFRVFFRNAPGEEGEWIGLFPLDGPLETLREKQELRREKDGELTFYAPEGGTYEFRLYDKRGKELLARSNVVWVDSHREKDVSRWIPIEIAETISLEVPENWGTLTEEDGLETGQSGWFHGKPEDPDMVFTLALSPLNGTIMDDLCTAFQEIHTHGITFQTCRTEVEDTFPVTVWFGKTTEPISNKGALMFTAAAFSSHWMRAEPIFTHMVDSIRVGEPQLPQPHLSVFPNILSPSGVLTVNFAGANGFRRDWLGIFPLGAGEEEYVEWQYLDGEQEGTVSFPVPAAEGEYEVRMFMNDSFTELARSEPFAVRSSQ